MGLSLQQLCWPLSLSMSSSFDPDDALAPSASPTASAEERLFRDLVQEHSVRLQRFIVRHIGNTSEAEDLAQQAFTEAARSYRTFRGESQLSTWLYGIALNLVRNHLSRAPERRYDFVGDSGLADLASESVTPEQAAEQSQSMRLLQESLDELPESMRSILLLVGLDNLSYEEAAALLSVPIGTVRSRLSRARTALRDRLEKKGLTLNF
jgi:RNA polymerase sigma factor (sigma-70 family)